MLTAVRNSDDVIIILLPNRENGATNVIPGSHGSHDPADPAPSRQLCQHATMKAGSVLLFTGSVWHSAGAAVAETAPDPAGGRGSGRRRGRQGLLCQYICGWLHGEYNLHFAIDPAVSSSALFDEPGLKSLLGFDGPRLFNGKMDGWMDGPTNRAGSKSYCYIVISARTHACTHAHARSCRKRCRCRRQQGQWQCLQLYHCCCCRLRLNHHCSGCTVMPMPILLNLLSVSTPVVVWSVVGEGFVLFSLA